MNRVQTPFGEIKVMIDGIECPYSVQEVKPNEKYCPDVIGRYHIVVDYDVDGDEHIISCSIPNMKYIDRGPESGEMLECQAFYDADGMKLSFGVECESGVLPNGQRWSDRYDYDTIYLENGMAYKILKNTVTCHYVFGVAWIDGVEDNHSRDVQTWFAADVTME